MSELISFGAGVNSVALAILLVNEGWRGPIVFADTGCEWPETYEYIEMFEREWLSPRGLSVTRLSGLPWQSCSGLPLYEYCEVYHIIPLRYPRWCTARYKVKALARWAKANEISVQHTGIAADESRRQPKKSRPLCERGITRQGCKELIANEGLPIPGRSNCWICPMQTREQWKTLYYLHPDLYERAMKLEESVKRGREGRHRATLDPSGKLTLRDRIALFEQEASNGDAFI